MVDNIKLYSRVSDKETILELWGASTKHPDSTFCFSNFRKCEFVDEDAQIFQWLLECASKLNFPFHAMELAEFAMRYENTKYLKKYIAKKKKI